MNKKVPDIRFGEFYGEWDEKTLKQIAEKVIERNDRRKYTETFTNSAEHGIISQRDYFDHDISNADNINGYYIVAENDFVYNPRISTNAPVGPINRNKLERKGIMSPLYTVFRPHDVEHSYLEWFFKSSYWHTYMFYNGDNGARYDRFSIKDDVLFGMPIPLPICHEQQKIGEFFSHIYSLITTANDRREKLLAFKKAMLQKMFPQEGERVPRIRFGEFEEEWELKKFGDLYQSVSEKNDMSFGIDKIITVATMQFNPKIILSNEDYLRTYNICRKGDIVFEGHNSKEFRYGRFVENHIGDGIVSHIFSVFRPISNYDLSFWKFYINNEQVMWRLLMRSTKSSTMMHDLVVDDIKSEKLLVPSLAEQQKIGAYFDALEDAIAAQEQKIEKLKQMKSALMQKMFI